MTATWKDAVGASEQAEGFAPKTSSDSSVLISEAAYFGSNRGDGMSTASLLRPATPAKVPSGPLASVAAAAAQFRDPLLSIMNFHLKKMDLLDLLEKYTTGPVNLLIL
jgi:hypothetical protein